MLSLLTFGILEAMFQLFITTQTSHYIRILFTLVHKITPCKSLLHWLLFVKRFGLYQEEKCRISGQNFFSVFLCLHFSFHE